MAKPRIITPDRSIVSATGVAAAPPEQMRPLTPADLPFKAVTWYMVVEPRLPKGYVGSIQLAEETKQVEEIQTTIGTILSKGRLFGESRTQSGLRLNDDPDFAALKVGDNVLYARYTGQKVHIRVDGKKRPVVILTDTEIMSIVDGDMDSIAFWI